MTLTVWSLNGGRFIGKTPDEEPRTLTWLKSLSEPGAVLPDVLCLQDFRVSLLQYLRPLPHFHFIPMANHKIWGKRELWGACIASKHPINDISIHCAWGDGAIRDLEGVGDDSRRIKPDDVADRLVLETQNWTAAACTIDADDLGSYRIATHHGLWVRDGVPTMEQMQSTDSLCSFLAEQGRWYNGVVYAADCNPDKEGRVLRTYAESGGRDCLPPHIETTLADHHPAAKFGIKSDHVVLWPNASGKLTYRVEDVYLDPSPGSDHQMLCFRVDRL